MSIQAILFDDGVVQRPASFRRALWVKILGGAEESVDAFVTDLFAVEERCLSGGSKFHDHLPRVLTRWQCTGAMQDVLHAWTAIHVDREIVEIICTLKVKHPGLRCCLATNQEECRAQYMSDTLDYGSLFDKQFYSCELGLSKPDPAYFRSILATLDLLPERVLFIDDTQINVAAAAAMGIRAERFVPVGLESRKQMKEILNRHGVSLDE